MSLSSHLVELRKKHATLEQKIEEALKSPASSDLRIAEMKRQKLRLKDEIVRLGGAETIH
ncbi:MAG: YdcH family protein [Pikeienuella sp.]|uniref:YdcH family protein n=1 Tax=Pikeienuella sp. TaxID=2831957 RepID=UPI00391B1FE4